MQAVQRQTSAYLCRAHTGTPRMFRASTRPTTAEDFHVDLTWQIQLPRMEWSGAAINVRSQFQKSYALKDAIEGKFLCERGGKYDFADADDDDSAQWFFVPFDDDTELLMFATTHFIVSPMPDCLVA